MSESEYDKQANDFLTKTNTTFSVKFLKHDFYFDEKDHKRDIYEITLQRADRKFVFTFGQSIANSGRYSYYSSEKGLLVSNDKKQLNKLVGRTISVGEIRLNDEQREPKSYDILASLQKYDVGNFFNFCDDFGYDRDSIKASKIYDAVVLEYDNLKMLYSDDELAEMQEIQ